MSTLAELPELIGFFSYSREDDEAFRGTLSALREGIQRELSAQLGRSKKNFRLWQDQAAIAPGKLWEKEIKTAIDQSVFFIPIVTPRAVNSKYCKFEFETFLAREAAIGRNDLVFPIVYISVAALESEASWRDDPVLSTIARRQYVDWRPLRHLDAQTTVAREQIERLCQKIVEALREPWISPEERRRMAEAEARKRAEDEARRLEAEAEQRAEESRRRAEVEARKRAEDKAWRLEAEKLASVAANRVDDVGAVDASLTDQPESNPTIKAPAAQERVVAGAAAERTLRKLEMSGSKRVSATFRGRFKFAPLIAIPVLLFVYVLMTNSWRIVSVQDTPSQSAKIELQSAKSELPGSQTVKGEGPDSQPVKREVPDPQTVKREAPDSQTAKSEVPDRQFLIGTWRSHQMENGQDVLIYWTIKGDGTTSYDYYVDGQKTDVPPSKWTYASGFFQEENERGGSGRCPVRATGPDSFQIEIVEHGIKRNYTRVGPPSRS
jgi:F0F1-type ATP synthase membrane subunit b/b'